MDITLIPAQVKGMRTGATAHHETVTRHDAILLFEKAKARLMDVNRWQQLAGPASAEFRLCDAQGNELSATRATVGDLIRIKLPAPPNTEGDGYDWVRVEEFESYKDLLKDQEIFGFRVRPVQSPFSADRAAAHFYTSAATSTFLVVRESTTVSAMEKGRNEVPNNWPAALLSRVRNLAVSVGAWLGLSHTQWGRLVKGFIKGPPQED